MKTSFTSLLTFIKTTKGMVAIAAIAIVIVGGYFILKPKNQKIETITVTPSDFVQEVSVTGKVVPSENVKLAFETSGRIAAVYKDVGDRVNQGEAIAVLSSDELQANLLKAQSDLDAQQAKLSQISTNSANPVDLINAKNSVIDTLKDSYSKADDAVRNKTDQFFKDPRKTQPEIIFAFDDYNLYVDINARRAALEYALVSWQAAIDRLSLSSFSNDDIALAKKNLQSVQSFLDKVALAVNNFKTNSSLSQATIDGYRADVASARSSINNALANITSAEQKLNDNTSNAVVQGAQVKSAEAVVAQYQAQLAKTVMRAPFSGTITLQDAKVGQIASVNTNLVGLISAGNYEIEAFVPEADVAKIAVGDEAHVTLDAYGSGVNFPVKITHIDPAETIVDGVSTYKTKFQFVDNDSRIKSGMTANIDIQTEKKANALLIPQRLVVTDVTGAKTVSVVVGDVEQKRTITTGKVDIKGNIEVLTGLQAGDAVVAATVK